VGAVAAFAFGFIERHICVFESEFCRVVVGVDRVADAECHERALCSPAIEKPACDVVSGVRCGPRADEEEFLAAVARDRVGRAGGRGEVVAERGEDLVAWLGGRGNR